MRVECEWCHAEVDERSVCPWSIECPTCGSAPGKRCRRPSEHDAAQMHSTRWREAERLDVEAGVTYGS